MDEKLNWVKEHRRQLMAGFAVLAVIVLIIGLCLSWFVYNKSLSTVGSMKQPSDLVLTGPNQTSIEQIDLTYDPKLDVDDKGYVTLKKPFSVKSKDAETKYSLFLARTTNINGLDIKLYRATPKANPSEDDAKNAYVAGLDNRGKLYAWNKDGDDLIPFGSYINKLPDSMKAKEDHDDQTFDSKLALDKLERSASPVYWKLSGQNTGEDSVDNYIIELTWQESQKETDVLYLIASGEN